MEPDELTLLSFVPRFLSFPHPSHNSTLAVAGWPQRTGWLLNTGSTEYSRDAIKKRPFMSQQITKCKFNLKTRSKMHQTFVSKQHQQSGSALGQKQDYCRRCVISINSWTSRSLTTIGQQKTCEVSRGDIRPNCYKKKYTLSVAMRLGQSTHNWTQSTNIVFGR